MYHAHQFETRSTPRNLADSYKRMIIMRGTLSHSIISKSCPPPEQDPIILTISLELACTEEPLTFWLYDSFIGPNNYDPWSIPFGLYDRTVERKTMGCAADHVLRRTCFRSVVDPDNVDEEDVNRLITLKPGIPFEMKTKFKPGVFAGKKLGGRSEASEDYICSTNIEDLEVGHLYQVIFTPRGRYIWCTLSPRWWDLETKDSLIKKYVSAEKCNIEGDRKFVIDHNNSREGSWDTQIVMEDGPAEFLVVG